MCSQWRRGVTLKLLMIYLTSECELVRHKHRSWCLGSDEVYGSIPCLTISSVVVQLEEFPTENVGSNPTHTINLGSVNLAGLFILN